MPCQDSKSRHPVSCFHVWTPMAVHVHVTPHGMAMMPAFNGPTRRLLPLRERLAVAAMASDQSPMSTLSSGNPQSGMAQQSFQQSKHQVREKVGKKRHGIDDFFRLIDCSHLYRTIWCILGCGHWNLEFITLEYWKFHVLVMLSLRRWRLNTLIIFFFVDETACAAPAAADVLATAEPRDGAAKWCSNIFFLFEFVFFLFALFFEILL